MAIPDQEQITSLSTDFFSSLLEEIDGKRIQKCIQCGMCTGICPFGIWMDFAPRRMIAALKADLFDQVLDTETVWMCVSCQACAEVCPAEIPLTTTLITRTKEEMVLAGNVPAELQTALEHSQRYGNPQGESPRKRAAWTKAIDMPIAIMAKARAPVEVLWFVGDYASYHPRAQEATVAFARILRLLGVDFGILGPEENSDGDSQRLAGERGLFEFLAEKNGRALGKYQFNEIVTTDPHAYNAIKNEYPAYGISYPVKHYTEFLFSRLDQLRPLLKNEIRAYVTFHDPCYLGRVNGVFDEPRALLEAIPGVELIEMAHHRTASLCCGGGGGGMWLDGFQWEISKNRLSEWRVLEAMSAHPYNPFFTAFELKKRRKKRPEKAAETPTERILAVACPYEAPRFEDAAKVVPGAEKLIVKDIAELLLESIGNME